jgi:hypothetical protein
MSELKKIIDGIDEDLCKAIGDVDKVAPGKTKRRLKNIMQRIDPVEGKVISSLIDNLFENGWGIRTARLVDAGINVLYVVLRGVVFVLNLSLCPLIIIHNLATWKKRRNYKELNERLKEIDELKVTIKETEEGLC